MNKFYKVFFWAIIILLVVGGSLFWFFIRLMQYMSPRGF